jgi:hypothetical protein
MHSSLRINEFQQRLSDKVSKGQVFNFLFPSDSSGKPFCGNFTNSEFSIRRNSYWIHVNSISIKGTYTDDNNNGTSIKYALGLTKNHKYFIGLGYILAFIIINTLIISNREELTESLNYILLSLNGFLLVSCLYLFVVIKVTTRIVSSRFKETFKIKSESENTAHNMV